MSPYEDAGGSGGLARRPSIAEFKLLRKAARERWGVPDHVRTLALRDAEATYLDREATYRDKNAASKFLIAADQVDLDSARFDAATYAAPPPTDDFLMVIFDLAPTDPA